MCCTLRPARLSKTTIYSAEVYHPDQGHCHVIGYQNSVRAVGPNAMILPFPAEGKMGPENVVNDPQLKHVLGIYQSAVKSLGPNNDERMSKGPRRYGAALTSRRAQVFESGSYTIALADQVMDLSEALTRIPEEKRPEISDEFLKGLSALYPDWPIALCCFKGSMDSPEPLFWWFKPRFPEVLFAPAIDAHDGDAPSLEGQVARDHTIAFASYLSDRNPRDHLQNRLQQNVPLKHQWMFDPHVCGRVIGGSTRNGDFVHDVQEVRSKNVHPWLNLKIAPPPQDRPTKWSILTGPDTL